MGLTWADVDRLCDAIVERLGTDGTRVDRVVAVVRGGLVPAALVAARLGLRCVETIRVRHYDGRSRLAAPVLDGAAPGAEGPEGDPGRTLVVDDVLETGLTFACVRRKLPRAVYAVLVAKGEDATVICGTRARPDRWVSFPWSGPDESQP
jgi:xanthine phosphoribosyltransferase